MSDATSAPEHEKSTDDVVNELRADSAAVGVIPLLKKRDLVQLAADRIESDADLLELPNPRAVIADLHRQPDCEARLGDEYVLLKAFRNDSAVVIVEARWAVSWRENLQPAHATDITLDDYVIGWDDERLRVRAEEIARICQFSPRDPVARIALLVSGRREGEHPGLTDSLVAAASVSGCGVSVVPRVNARDQKSIGRARRFALENRHHAVFTCSLPNEKWVTRLVGALEEKKRPAVRLPIGEPEVVLASLRLKAADVLERVPDRPTLRWGPEAQQRISVLVGDAFSLSDRAWRHLGKNPYPRTERMLTHLERLAWAAQDFHDQSGEVDGRFEDWIRAEHDLVVAMRDKGISARDSEFEFDGQKFSNQPHVKVDDGVARTECGRIYFAICSSRHRLIVDYIGIHDRS